MQNLIFENNSYQSPARKLSLFARLFPTFTFYCTLIFIVIKASRAAHKGVYGNDDWVKSSYAVLRSLEKVGIRLDVSGIDNVKNTVGPVIIVGNHMSMMETLILPGIVQPIKPLTFVVKEDLLNYPVFKYVMRSRNPIAVTRTNPRQDLKTVLSEGVDRIENDISVIVFPQTTRAHSFDPSQMSTIGVKLAKKSGITIIPLALKTDCWENGRKIKDFGRLNLSKTAYFSFGPPLEITGKGDNEQEQINKFISSKLAEWEETGG
ncbi:1-acyl-sn-glycerol-3-phosphate acyltransferase [Desulforhopalus sp. IMCC35007]|uniref:lysophospholipid acyltransferase family protein n=1 Tax=Desulforhopalus sp. IMCC35007 TaxID=2569543 RepID=UPI0010AE42B7|nr:lysophospholipid acyltransferase family protein [Desulforhopalus sp. IMCC35007]TKB12078.1 1-acyl-sn-glycerol-3-phosphate acyltransferase [Desulforhopalus sp. IMCC35007]